MSNTTKLAKAHEILDNYENEHEGYSMLMLSIEFDPEMQPHSKGLRAIGPIPATLASITILRTMLDQLEDDVLSKIDQMGDANEKLSEFFNNVMGTDDVNDPRIEQFLKNLTDRDKDELKDLIKHFKRKFGK